MNVWLTPSSYAYEEMFFAIKSSEILWKFSIYCREIVAVPEKISEKGNLIYLRTVSHSAVQVFKRPSIYEISYYMTACARVYEID